MNFSQLGKQDFGRLWQQAKYAKSYFTYCLKKKERLIALGSQQKDFIFFFRYYSLSELRLKSACKSSCSSARAQLQIYKS